MSHPKNQNWTLMDKQKNPPSADMMKKLENLLKILNKDQLFPCPGTPDELEMQKKETAPREMNSFMVFRRQFAIIVKELKLSDDGKILSKAASYIWNGSSNDEKKSYRDMAGELKRRHLARYPEYTFERRKRKTADEDFVIVEAGTIAQKKRKIKDPKPKTNAASNPVSEEHPLVVSTSISQEQENAKLLYNNSLNPTFPLLDSDNLWNDETLLQEPYFLYPENHRDPIFANGIDFPSIPVMNTVLSQNYANMSPQDINQLRRQLSLQNQQFSQYINLPQHVNLPQVDVQDAYLFQGGDPGINQPSSNYYYNLERPVDELGIFNLQANTY